MGEPSLVLLSEKIIKPSSPTPLSLKSYKLSLLDQLTSGGYMPIILFYPSQNHNNKISNLLETSLSKLLVSYYPLAGTMEDNNVFINCNDKGATFKETRINCNMSEILEDADANDFSFLLPVVPWSPELKDKLVLVQLNHFDCGGVALGFCMSHKMGDGYSMARFLSDWASLTREPTKEPTTQFIGDSIFPGQVVPTTHVPVVRMPRDEKYVAKLFSLNGKSIAKLKKVVSVESGVQNPTRVEVVTAFLLKCAVMAASTVHSQSFKPLALVHYVNLRPLTEPALPLNSIGNIYHFFSISVATQEEMELPRLVRKLRKSKLELYEKVKKVNLSEILTSGNEMMDKLMENYHSQGLELFRCSSMCGFPFNELDFGWKKPTKVCCEPAVMCNAFFMKDDHDGDGVDATVILDEKVMDIFKNNKEVIEFSTNQIS